MAFCIGTELGALFVVSSAGSVLRWGRAMRQKVEQGGRQVRPDAPNADKIGTRASIAARDPGGFLLSSTQNPLTGQRILVAEDEGLIALELERMLQGFGCEVVGPVSSVREVLDHAIKGGCDGALLDVNLRGQQIFEILPKLEDLGLRLIITSGYNDVSLFPAAFRGVPRIAKPFDERELRRICENVFAKSTSRSQSVAR
jgi:CheY-like chemotaxis protein